MFTLKSKLRRSKEEARFELQSDLNYIKKFKRKELYYDEAEARKELSKLKSREVPTGEELNRIGELNENITASRTIKAQVEQATRVIYEMGEYISMLK